MTDGRNPRPPATNRKPVTMPAFARVFGVDFSGAKKAGDFIWVAEVVPTRAGFRLASLRPMTAVCGTPDRAVVHARLVEMVLASERALWGFDFPFGLPVELFPPGTPWAAQFDFLAEYGDEAYACGLECVRRATELVRRKHIRRATDAAAKAPFDTFHYRTSRGQRILPKHYEFQRFTPSHGSHKVQQMAPFGRVYCTFTAHSPHPRRRPSR